MSIEQIETILHREGVWEGELRHRTRDGRRIVIASQWVLHTDSTGKIICILEASTDITARKQAGAM
jgi:PAS domain-containing protein